MTVLEGLEEILEKTGLPVVYRAWPEDAAPPMPYVCYYVPETNNFAADGIAYYPVNRVQVELYTELKEPKTEEVLEKALNVFCWEKTEAYIDSEKCYQITYEIEV